MYTFRNSKKGEHFKIHYQKVIDGQIRPTELMKQLGISKSTYYRYV